MLNGTLVRLRKYEPEDIDRLLLWMNDDEVTQYLAARWPISRGFEEAWVKRVATQEPSQGVSLAIETLADGRHIGSVGLHAMHWEDSHCSLGINIGDKAYWGRGYGTDAMVTLLRFGFEWMNLHRVTLEVLASNERAIASYRKCGFVDEGTLRQAYYQRGEYHGLLTMGVLRDEFLALHGASAEAAS